MLKASDERGLRVLAIPLAIMALALGAIAAGCGDDDDEAEEAATTPATETNGGGAAGGGDTVDISLVDFAIEPDQVDVAAGPVTFDVANDGEAPHNLEIEGGGVEEVLPEDLQAGQSGTLEVDLQAGTYEMYCPVGNHADMGMVGELTVE
jgi:plastocyanin